MANKDFQNGLIVGLSAGSVKVASGGTDWGDTITDDWATIISNAAAGTVSGYTVGQTKTVEFIYNGMPAAIQFMLVAKSHETISGSQDKAALTFMAKYIQLHGQMNDTNTNVGGWLGATGDLYADSLNETDNELTYGCVARKMLWQLYKAFPSALQTGIKTVDKEYDDADDSVRTSKEKLFLPCLEEVGATYNNGSAMTNESIYTYFNASADNKKLTGFGAPYYSLRVRRKTNTAQFCVVTTSSGSGTANNASTTNAFCPIFCI